MTTVILLLIGLFMYLLLLLVFIRFFQVIHECDVSIREMTAPKRRHYQTRRKKTKRTLRLARA